MSQWSCRSLLAAVELQLRLYIVFPKGAFSKGWIPSGATHVIMCRYAIMCWVQSQQAEDQWVSSLQLSYMWLKNPLSYSFLLVYFTTNCNKYNFTVYVKTERLRHCFLSYMLMESQVKFFSPQNISGASQQNKRTWTLKTRTLKKTLMQGRANTFS